MKVNDGENVSKEEIVEKFLFWKKRNDRARVRNRNPKREIVREMKKRGREK